MLHCPRCSRSLLSVSDCSENCCAPTNCQTKTMSGGIIQYPSSTAMPPSFHLYQNTSLDSRSTLHSSLDMKTCVQSNLGHSGGSCVDELTAYPQSRTESDSEKVKEQLRMDHWRVQKEIRQLREQSIQLEIKRLNKQLEESKLEEEMLINNCHPQFPNSSIFLKDLPRPNTPPSPSNKNSSILAISQKELVQSNWYYQYLDYQSSHALLANSSPGTFLLRDSQHPGCNFTLSFQRHKEGPTSIRIQLSGGKFFLDADERIRSSMPKFNSVCKLVEHYLKEERYQKGKKPKEETSTVPMVLKKPLYNQVPSLKHLARLSINRTLLENDKKEDGINKLESVLPQQLLQFLKRYPVIV